MAVDAGLPRPPGIRFHIASVYILHYWLAEFGYTSLQELRDRLADLRASAPAILRDFGLCCEADDPPYAVGVDVIRIILGTGTTTHYLCYCDGTSWKQASAPGSTCTW